MMIRFSIGPFILTNDESYDVQGGILFLYEVHFQLWSFPSNNFNIYQYTFFYKPERPKERVRKCLASTIITSNKISLINDFSSFL